MNRHLIEKEFTCDLTCTGQVKTLVTTGNGSRKVETYAEQSPENWMGDFGSATLTGGVAVVKVDPAFAETVSATADYHFFLTPNGDSRGLCVVGKTATSFEAPESGGGTSSLSFDYRIVAMRRGYEGQRLTDVTEPFNVAARAADLYAIFTRWEAAAALNFGVADQRLRLSRGPAECIGRREEKGPFNALDGPFPQGCGDLRGSAT